MFTPAGISEPTDLDLLVAFFDLTGFAKFARKATSREAFDMLSDFFELVGDSVEESGGKVVKFIGDAGLVVYPEDRADEGVRALHALKAAADRWLAGRGLASRVHIKAHFGPVTCGPVGTRSEKRFDVYGETVNTAATLPSHGLSITPQAFRKLGPETRKLFKKHTPPVRYIPVEEGHRD
ncbi:MAG: adenylate/guanylate cyclase domain-containing protein [Planctomycetota bacterium]|jgi:class 3 adenylate cyclase